MKKNPDISALLEEVKLLRREQEVEAALEDLRARSMAMHKREELIQVVRILDKALSGLGIETDVPQIQTDFANPENGFNVWLSRKGQDYLEKFHIPFIKHPIFKKLWTAVQKGTEFYTESYSKTEKNEIFKILFENSDYSAVSEEQQNFVYSTQGLIRVSVLSKNSILVFQRFDLKEFSKEEEEIFKRFGKVFEQAYVRFLDLQKAEEQAREAQIEAALEKVRSRSLAMHKSDELQEVANTVFANLKGLNIQMDTASILLLSEQNADLNIWIGMESDRGYSTTSIHVPEINDPDIEYHNELIKTRENLFTKSYTYEEKNKLWNYLFKHSGFKIIPDERKKMILDAKSYIISIALYKNTGIQLIRYSGLPFSEKENETLQRFGKVFEQAYVRFLDLQKAEAQAREAQIEMALEKVRSASMAMHKSDDLLLVIKAVQEQITELGIKVDASNFQTYIENSRDFYIWPITTTHSYQQKLRVAYIDFGMTKKMWDAWEKGDSFVELQADAEEMQRWWKKAFEVSELSHTPQGRREIILSAPGWNTILSRGKTCGLQLHRYNLESFTEQEKDILERLATVFEQSYIRFLDLQKAEAQAREAKIETALERVRSRSMAMHNSNELRDVVNTLHNELRSLNVNFHVVVIQLLMGDTKGINLWVGTSDGVYDDLVYWPYVDIRIRNEMYQAQLSKSPFEIVLTHAETIEFFEEYFKVEGTPQERKAATAAVELIDTMGFYQANTGVILMRYSEGSYSEDEKIITERFSKVFEQTYTRFLDLQKAEAQAREAEIQLALERVRARTMAMQKQDDLLGVLDLLLEQLTKLGVQLDVANFSDGLPVGDWNLWVLTVRGNGATSTDYVHFPKINHPYFLSLEEDLENYKIYGTDLSKAAFTKEQKDSFLDYCFSQTKYRDSTPLEVRQYLYDKPGYAWSAILLKETWVSICRHDGIAFSDEEDALLRRFANSFGQAYTRFLDLQKAEAQAREAIKQASLDRVRGEIASMRSAADLELITPLIFRELTIFGVPFIRCGVFIIQEKEEIIEAYLSSPDGNSLGALRLPFQASELTSQSVEAWRKGLVYRQHWNKEDFVRWIKQLMEQDQIQDSSTYQGSAAPPESLDLHFVPFTQGMLYVGAVSPLSEDEIELVQSLANAFSIAFARYEDFVKLEQAKAEVESAMSELKATQSQLIQQEKLASLGQLTAGIAHEIKNPLNFINNFSEVNLELVNEIREERAKNLDTRDETLVDELLEDIRANLEKVHEHGTRADQIVKSMLQHSRSGDNKKALKPLNPIIKEFVNLAYHGMRASKTPIEVAIDLQLSEEVGEVELIAEDFSRVVLNLCNNGFDAMREKLLKTVDGRQKTEEGQNGKVEYQARLIVKTALEGDKVLLSIADNGSGIPEEIRDKILQPFFTTKKGTDGTGLGLSITNDIIKAHGGELKMESKEGEGSSFVIIMPKTNA